MPRKAGADAKIARKTRLLDGKWRPAPIGGEKGRDQDGEGWWLCRGWMIGGRLENGCLSALYQVVEEGEWKPVEFASEADAAKLAARLNRQLARQAKAGGQ